MANQNVSLVIKAYDKVSSIFKDIESSGKGLSKKYETLGGQLANDSPSVVELAADGQHPVFHGASSILLGPGCGRYTGWRRK